MQKLITKSFAIALSATLLTPTLTTAKSNNPVARCKEVIDACDQTINFYRDRVDAQQELQKELENVLARTDADLKKAQKINKAWYKNPFIIGILGFSAGVITHEFAK